MLHLLMGDCAVDNSVDYVTVYLAQAYQAFLRLCIVYLSVLYVSLPFRRRVYLSFFIIAFSFIFLLTLVKHNEERKKHILVDRSRGHPHNIPIISSLVVVPAVDAGENVRSCKTWVAALRSWCGSLLSVSVFVWKNATEEQRISTVFLLSSQGGRHVCDSADILQVIVTYIINI